MQNVEPGKGLDSIAQIADGYAKEAVLACGDQIRKRLIIGVV